MFEKLKKKFCSIFCFVVKLYHVRIVYGEKKKKLKKKKSVSNKVSFHVAGDGNLVKLSLTRASYLAN